MTSVNYVSTLFDDKDLLKAVERQKAELEYYNNKEIIFNLKKKLIETENKRLKLVKQYQDKYKVKGNCSIDYGN